MGHDVTGGDAAQVEALAQALALDAIRIGSPGSLAPPGLPRRSRGEERRFPRVRLLGAAALALGLVAVTPRSLGLGSGDRLLEQNRSNITLSAGAEPDKKAN